MPDEINFLPEKEKEIKEKQQAKKAKSGVKFHTPKFEEAKKDEGVGSFPTVVGFLNNLKLVLKNAFKSKKKKDPEINIKKPVQLTAKPTKPTDIIQAKKTSTEVGLKPSAPIKESSVVPEPPVSPITNVTDDLDGEYSEVDVNLMPWQDPSVKRFKQIGFFLLIVSIMVIAIWGTVLRMNNKQKSKTIEELTSQIEATDAQLAAINADLFSQSNDIGLRRREFVNLFLTIPRWSKFLSWLEATTHKSVYFEKITANETDFSIPVVAPDYETAVQQWLAFRNATLWVDSVFVPGISNTGDLDEERVNFEAKIKFKEGALKISSDDF